MGLIQRRCRGKSVITIWASWLGWKKSGTGMKGISKFALEILTREIIMEWNKMDWISDHSCTLGNGGRRNAYGSVIEVVHRLQQRYWTDRRSTLEVEHR